MADKNNKSKYKKVDEQIKKDAREFKKQFAGRTFNLITSAFGLVAALAWNDLIKKVVQGYVEKIFGEQAGIISQLIYALLITALAVFVTYQFGKLAEDEKEKK